MMTTLLLLCFATVLAVIFAGDYISGENAKKKPNFIVFLMDDVRTL